MAYLLSEPYRLLGFEHFNDVPLVRSSPFDRDHITHNKIRQAYALPTPF